MAKINFDISKRLDITIRQGDSFKLELTLKDSSDNALNLYGDKFFFQVTRFIDNPSADTGSAETTIQMHSVGDNSLALEGTASLTPVSPQITDDETTTASTATGKVTFEASATDMKYFANSEANDNPRMVYDIQYVDSDDLVDGEGNARTILYGSFYVKRDLTQTA